MFLGMDVFSGKYAMTPQYISMDAIGDVTLKNGTYDHLYISIDANMTVDDINNEWNYATRLNAKYDDSLNGGNSSFSLKNTDTIIIKYREKGTINWTTIFAIPVKELADFNFLKEFKYNKTGADYEFMVISSMGGVQNSYEIAECHSEFEGICLADKNTFYKTVFNITPIDMTRNISSNVLALLNDTYPVVVSNDDTNYDSGSVSAVFLKIENCDIKTGYQSTKYRKEIIDWLVNKKAKILKLDNGEVKMIRVVGKPSITDDGHPELQRINFEFVEIGNANKELDLYKNNLSDVDPGRW